MIGLYVHVPVACFRKGLAREYLETEQLPPPATCYGFLLALVGESDRDRHIGVRVTPMLLGDPARSVVLRTVWRIKHKDRAPGGTGNRRPDYQQLLTGVELLIWLDSDGEETLDGPTLEQRVRTALVPEQRGRINRFGGLSLGESTHLVDEVSLLNETRAQSLQQRFPAAEQRRLFKVNEHDGRLTLPVWVDHVGSAGTRHAVGDLVPTDISEPERSTLPRIGPREK